MLSKTVTISHQHCTTENEHLMHCNDSVNIWYAESTLPLTADECMLLNKAINKLLGRWQPATEHEVALDEVEVL